VLHKPDKEVDLYVDTTADKFTTIRTPRRFCKIDMTNYENSPQHIDLHSVFTQMSELNRLNVFPQACIDVFYCNYVISYCMKRILHKCSLTLRHIGHTSTNNGFFELMEALLYRLTHASFHKV